MERGTRVSTDIAIIQDLRPLRLEPKDIDARPLTTIDQEMLGLGAPITGYRIPYYDIAGRPVKHSRIRQIDIRSPASARKALAPPPKNGSGGGTGTSAGNGVTAHTAAATALPAPSGSFIRTSKDETRIYFPIGFAGLLRTPKVLSVPYASDGWMPTASAGAGASANVSALGAGASTALSSRDRAVVPLIVVDDERVAAYITQHHGLMAVAVQGPAGWQAHAGLAAGFKELVEEIIAGGLTVVLWIGDGTDRNIQREVANLAMELKFHGVPFANVRQYKGTRLVDASLKLALSPMSAFPRHPNIRAYIADKIGDTGAKLTRREQMEIGLAILSDMEANGARIRSTNDNGYYYFNQSTRELVRASIMYGKELIVHSDFVQYIYTKYGVSPNDNQILRWFATQFASEEPIHRSRSYKVLMAEPRQESTFAMQVGASEFITLDCREGSGGGEARIVTNGTGGILFEKTSVEPLDLEKLDAEMKKQRRHETLPMWWLDVMREVRMENKDDQYRTMIALLYYVSPWLKGWREMQLPIEVVVGEPGTGKSSLFSMRMKILTGVPDLKGLPATFKDFHASIAQTSGILVADNVHLASRTYRQALSDEMCRIITEPRPTIEMRQLYTTAEVAKFPVHCTFGITSVENVFTNVDFIQRAIIMQLERAYDMELLFGDWVNSKIAARGGREAWLAHQIVALERFFEEVRVSWNSAYRSKTRLINFEQTLMVMGRVFGMDCAWLPDLLHKTNTRNAVTLDWVLEGLNSFVESAREGNVGRRDKTHIYFSAADIVDWAITNDEFEDNHTLTNARRLGRYILTNKTTVLTTTGIKVLKSPSGKNTTYVVDAVPPTKDKSRASNDKVRHTQSSRRHS